jgi:hypothetical protein
MKIAPMIRVIDRRTFAGLQLMSSVSFGWGFLAAVEHRVSLRSTI